MTREEFIDILDILGYGYEIVDERIRIISGNDKGIIDLGEIHHIPSDVEFTKDCGGVRLYELIELPPRVYFNNKSYVNLKSLEYINTDVEFNNVAMVHLDSLKELTTNIKFNNGGYVAAQKLEKISPDFEFNNKGHIFLPNFSTSSWGYSIEGVSNARIINFVIKKGLVNLAK